MGYIDEENLGCAFFLCGRRKSSLEYDRPVNFENKISYMHSSVQYSHTHYTYSMVRASRQFSKGIETVAFVSQEIGFPFVEKRPFVLREPAFYIQVSFPGCWHLRLRAGKLVDTWRWRWLIMIVFGSPTLSLPALVLKLLMMLSPLPSWLFPLSLEEDV